ncbi:MAG: hypothetical protein ACRCSQ_08285 [Bacteroidales bacterium]
MKRMYKIVTSLFFFIMIFSAADASDVCPRQKDANKGRMAEFFQQKKDFLIKEIGMTREEADQFFPLYDELQKKKFVLHRQLREKIKRIQNSKDAISEAEYAEVASAMNGIRLQEARLEDEYYKKFEKILSPEKLYKLQCAEHNFGKEMLRRGGGNRHGDLNKR